MSSLLRASPLTPHTQPDGFVPAASATAVQHVYDQLLSSLGGSRRPAGRGHLVGVASCRPGDGATHVAGALASTAARQGKRVVYAEPDSLLHALAVSPVNVLDLLDRCLPSRQPRLWSLPDTPRTGETAIPELATLQRRLEDMRSAVDMLVLDMGPVTSAGHVLRLCPGLDDLLLVVAAGETRRSQITYAQRLLAHAGAAFTGCVLNKRAYPLPSALFRALN